MKEFSFFKSIDDFTDFEPLHFLPKAGLTLVRAKPISVQVFESSHQEESTKVEPQEIGADNQPSETQKADSSANENSGFEILQTISTFEKKSFRSGLVSSSSSGSLNPPETTSSSSETFSSSNETTSEKTKSVFRKVTKQLSLESEKFILQTVLLSDSSLVQSFNLV